MKVLFVTHANRSHLYFMTPLAWALRIAGHQVRVAGQPEIVEEITRAGLLAVSAGKPTRALDNMPDDPPGTESERGPGPVVSGRQPMPIQQDYARQDPLGELHDITWNGYTLFSPESMIEDLVRFARGWKPDLVIWDAITFAGPIAARACGAAHARMLFGTDAMSQLRNAIRERDGSPGTELTTDPIRDWLQPILERYDCEFGEDVVSGQWTIDPMPPWHWRPPGAQYLLMRHVPYNGAMEVPEWLYEKPARKRVCVTLGITNREYFGAEASAAELLGALADLDIEVIATLDAKQLGSLPEIPDNLRVVDFVPMGALLPSCSAVIHHGGGGTFAAAVEHGVPQLLVPGTYWCIAWWGAISQANGLTENGAGLFVADSDHLTAEAVREDLVRVLDDPSFAENARRLRDESMAAPTPSELVPVLLGLTAAHRSAVR